MPQKPFRNFETCTNLVFGLYFKPGFFFTSVLKLKLNNIYFLKGKHNTIVDIPGFKNIQKYADYASKILYSSEYSL